MGQLTKIGNSRRTILGRLLWPVNLISFLLLLILCVMVVNRTEKAVESAMRSKAEGTVNFLKTIGENFLANNNTAALENFAAVTSSDSDYAYVAFFDRDDKQLTSSKQIVDDPRVTQISSEIRDAHGTKIGKIVLGYRHQRIEDSYSETVVLVLGSLILIQVLLSLALFLVSRSIVHPLQLSLERLTESTGVLSDTSKNVSKFSDALSNGVNQQAEVVQQTTAAMTEMSSMLAQTSNYAKQSEVVMANVTAKANSGVRVINQVVDAMTSVQQANEQLEQMTTMIQEIGNKTNVINDIVFKTQLLSFNAAIEAARAGQHGRGFAVVAEEVGNLAKMSGFAAKEITALLQDSERQVGMIVRSTHERVQFGKQVTEEAQVTFQEIASQINSASQQIGNISAAAREQELGVAQTNQAMGELNKTTDLSSQIAHRANETSRVLTTEVDVLRGISIAIQRSMNGHYDANSKKQTSGSTNAKFTALTAVPKSLKKKMGSSKPLEKDAAKASEVTPEMPAAMNQVTDRIVAMARKQRTEKKGPKKPNVG